jgi:NAD(P)-dependent dehydrogenase (short-subunit alcohol dehydrogenase family)
MAAHAAGANVVVCGRNIDTLAASVQSLDPVGESVLPARCDARNEQAVAEISTALERIGRIDALVNNSGIAGPTVPLWESLLSEWQDTLSTNLRGTFVLSRGLAVHDQSKLRQHREDRFGHR